MERPLTPKQRANAALKIVRELKRRRRQTALDAQKQEKSNDDSSSRFSKEIGRILNRATKTAFTKAGLNIDDSKDWDLLLPWLAWAIYGKTAGRKKRWNKRELRQLNGDVVKLRSKNTTLTEADCCRELTNHTDYVGLKARTLLRRLQQAKRLDSK
jgi:hypothetical protein